MKPRIPQYFTFQTDDGHDFRVAFDFDPGEEQSWNGLTGVGSPGYPASVEITDVDFGAGWKPLEAYPQLNIAGIEQAIMDRINDLYEDDAEQRAEYEREQIETARSIEHNGDDR